MNQISHTGENITLKYFSSGSILDFNSPSWPGCILTLLWTTASKAFKVPVSAGGEGDGTPLQCSCLENPVDGGAWWAAVHGVAKSQTRLSDFTFTFHFHALEKEMATHSNVLAWRIPGTGEPGGLPSLGSHRVGHNWSNLAAAAAVHILLPIKKLENLFLSLGCNKKLLYLIISDWFSPNL